jgi:hypothetical protein
MTTLGTVRVIWKLNGEVAKDRTVPFTHEELERISDNPTLNVPGYGKLPVDVEFVFDPPLQVSP